MAELKTDARRTNEIGVRMALGADCRAVLGLVFSQNLRLSLAGLAAGLVGALALTRALAGLLYEVSASEPWSLLASAFVLGTVAALATYIPARRAATIEPFAASSSLRTSDGFPAVSSWGRGPR